ncbi:RDD family protein [Acinetobacter sp. ANC 3832]|uniref:RDD family protein n=1 Tax=Acinetobacter sp. ANC 3832 TaxID=1977874 RepID=UPI000A358FB2|nr:RDD family protein [Acinetobacter sp. ANC 3832]OTG93412.1 RDD family protein [Acinetobacter sp. ANC 3832]
MQIYLARNNQQAGPYTIEQLNQMLASQQILLTDLAWHQGMTEWKALGELTQGKLVYEPTGYTPPVAPSQNTTYQNPAINKINVVAKNQEPASYNSRILAKILDLFLWIPAAIIPSFFLNPSQITELEALQQKMQAASSSTQAVQLQEQLLTLIPNNAWLFMCLYIVIMLAVQGFLIAKSGQSLGKRITGIKIVDADSGEKVPLVRAFFLRSVLFIILNLMVMPFVAIIDSVFGLSAKRQTLHDKLAKTKVIKQ